MIEICRMCLLGTQYVFCKSKGAGGLRKMRFAKKEYVLISLHIQLKVTTPTGFFMEHATGLVIFHHGTFYSDYLISFNRHWFFLLLIQVTKGMSGHLK